MTDTGLAADRTTLAWTRTSLGAAALGLLLLHTGTVHHSPLTLAAAAAVLVDAVVIGLAGRRRAASMSTAATAPLLLGTVTTLTVLAGGLATLAIIWSH